MVKKRTYNWDDSYYLRVYELALTGMTPTQVAKALGIPSAIWSKWMKSKPALRDTFDRAKVPASNSQSSRTVVANGVGERFVDFVYKRLSPELKELWQQIEHIDGGPMGEEDEKKRHPNAWQKIEKLFDREGGKRARQSLYVHALFASNFSPLEATRKVCISYTTLREWCKEEGFKQLLEEIEEMKADMVRHGIFRNVAAGEPTILRYAADRLCPEFAPPKQTIHHEGEVKQLRASLDLNQALEQLPLADRLLFLQKLRESQMPKALPPKEVG